MTEDRKTKVIDEFLTWMIEHHKNDEDLYFTLKNAIGLTQEELHEFDIESLDEYYEREHEKEKQETIDTMTGEDVMEATAYIANAPDCCSAEEKAENVLGMLGANIIDESIYHTEEAHAEAVGEREIDYEKEVLESVATEYAEFKASMTDGKTPEEVFEESYEIHIKTSFKDAIGEEYFTPEIYKALYQRKGEILQTLYDGYQADPSASGRIY